MPVPEITCITLVWLLYDPGIISSIAVNSPTLSHTLHVIVSTWFLTVLLSKILHTWCKVFSFYGSESYTEYVTCLAAQENWGWDSLLSNAEHKCTISYPRRSRHWEWPCRCGINHGQGMFVAFVYNIALLYDQDATRHCITPHSKDVSDTHKRIFTVAGRCIV